MKEEIIQKFLSLKVNSLLKYDEKLETISYNKDNVEFKVYRSYIGDKVRYNCFIDNNGSKADFNGEIARKCWHLFFKDTSSQGKKGRPNESLSYTDEEIQELMLDLPA